MKISDVQNYFLSLFGGIYEPNVDTIEEIEKEMESESEHENKLG